MIKVLMIKYSCYITLIALQLILHMIRSRENTNYVFLYVAEYDDFGFLVRTAAISTLYLERHDVSPNKS